MRSYQVVFFDVDHTLIDTKQQYVLAIPQVLQQLYGESAPPDFLDRFMNHNRLLFGLYDKRELTMDKLRRERFLRTWQEYGVSKTEAEADDFQQCYDALIPSTLLAYEGTLQMLATVQQSHEIGLITNGLPDHMWNRLEWTGLDRFFDESHVTVSADVGPSKPDPAVYAAACQKLNVTAGDCLMIGDHPRADVAGSRAFGMDAIWYVPDVTLFDAQGGLALIAAALGETAVTTPTELLKVIAQLEERRGN